MGWPTWVLTSRVFLLRSCYSVEIDPHVRATQMTLSSSGCMNIPILDGDFMVRRISHVALLLTQSALALLRAGPSIPNQLASDAERV